MIFSSRTPQNLTPEQQRILRSHWEWAGGYALFWIVVTVLIFAGIFVVLDYFGADDSVRVETLVLLGTITLVNAIWRAAGALGARIELIMTRQATNKSIGNSDAVKSEGRSAE